MPYSVEALYGNVAQVQHSTDDVFGSGWLIGRNLVLTARHVTLKGTVRPVEDGWHVRLMSGRRDACKWPWISAKVAWAGLGNLDLALLRLDLGEGAPDWNPTHRLRIGRIDAVEHHLVRGLGFPRGAKFNEKRTLLVPSGSLDEEDGETLFFGIDPFYRPDSPEADWPGFSGAAVLLEDSPDPDVVWVYGVAAHVPPRFTRRLAVARLAKAWEDEAFRDVFAQTNECVEAPDDPLVRARGRAGAVAPRPVDQVPLLERTAEDDVSAGFHRFLYRTRKVPFAGRERELATLNDFLSAAPRFLWFALTGPGGVGKSRLALEFCLQAQPTWRAGFLTKEWKTEAFDAWRPNQPTLIVADYVAARAEDVGRTVRALSLRSRELAFPVRILLLERKSDAPWVNQFFGTGTDLLPVEGAKYRAFPTGQLAAQPDLSGPAPKLDALELTGLSDVALWKSIASSVNASPSLRRLGPGDEARTLEQLRKIDPSGRPLFAALFAEAINANRDSLHWNREAFIQDILRREEQQIWRPAGVTADDKYLLALATMSGGIDLSRADLPQPIEDRLKEAVFSAERYGVLCGQRSYDFLAPLEPDILGEIFVLNHFERSSVRDGRARAAGQTAWRANATAMCAFLSRAAQDFPNDETLWLLGEYPTDEVPEQRYQWSLAAFYLLPARIKTGGPNDRQAVAWQRQLQSCYADLLSAAQATVEPRTLRSFVNDMSAAFVQIGKPDDAIAVYDAFIARFEDASEPELRAQVAKTFYNKALTLGQLNRLDDAIAAYDALIARFEDASEPELRERVAWALNDKAVRCVQLDRSDDAIGFYDALIARFENASELGLREPVAKGFYNKGLTLGLLNRPDEAIAVFDALIARFEDASEPRLRDYVAWAHYDKGVILAQLKRSDDAIAVFDALIARSEDASESVARLQAAKALDAKGLALAELKRLDDAITIFDALIARFADASEPDLREQVAKTFYHKGLTLRQFDRLDDALAVFDALVVRFGDASEPASGEPLARGLYNQACVLVDLDRLDEAIAVLDALIARFEDASERGLREQVANALFYKGFVFGRLNRRSDQIAVYDVLIGRFTGASEPDVRERIAAAFSNKFAALVQLNRLDEAIAVLDELIARFAAASEPGLRVRVGWALRGKGSALVELNRPDAAIEVYEALIARFEDASEPELREQVAEALYDKGATLGQLNRSDEAIAAYDALIARFEDASEPGLREQVVKASYNKGATLGQLKRWDDSIAVYDELLARFADASEPVTRQQVAKGFLNKAVTLGKLNRWDAALAVFDAFIARFEHATEPELREQVGAARINKAEIAARLESLR